MADSQPSFQVIMRYALFVPAVVCCLAASCGLADAGAPPASPKPYLAPASEPDELAILPAPPAENSPAAEEDSAIYTATRNLIGQARGRLATTDADRASEAVWADFGCALGAVVPADRVPTVIDLLGRLNEDIEQATGAVKSRYKRARPLVGNTDSLCVDRTDKLAASFSFPSGHATQGWATALVLAELAPDRATPLLQRGRVFGESRVVCGVHWLSDVEAGRTAAAVLVSVLHADAGFRHDLDQARAELIAARGAGAPAPDPGLCHAAAEAAIHPFVE